MSKNNKETFKAYDAITDKYQRHNHVVDLPQKILAQNAPLDQQLTL